MEDIPNSVKREGIMASSEVSKEPERLSCESTNHFDARLRGTVHTNFSGKIGKSV